MQLKENICHPSCTVLIHTAVDTSVQYQSCNIARYSVLSYRQHLHSYMNTQFTVLCFSEGIVYVYFFEEYSNPRVRMHEQ